MITLRQSIEPSLDFLNSSFECSKSTWLPSTVDHDPEARERLAFHKFLTLFPTCVAFPLLRFAHGADVDMALAPFAVRASCRSTRLTICGPLLTRCGLTEGSHDAFHRRLQGSLDRRE